MNKQKLVLLSLILPVLVSGSIQANPWKNTLKKAGYAGAAVLALYTGYQAAKAYGLFGQSEQPAQAPVVPAQNQPGVKTAQQLLEENQIKLIDARLAQRAASKEAAAQQAKAQEEANANRALGQQLQEEREIAANQKAHYERNITTQRGLLEARDMELRKLRASTAGQEIELQQLRQKLDEAYKAQASKPTLAVVIQEPPITLNDEYRRNILSNVTHLATQFDILDRGYDALAPTMKTADENTEYVRSRNIIQRTVQAFGQVLQQINQDPTFTNQATHQAAINAISEGRRIALELNTVFSKVKAETLSKIETEYTGGIYGFQKNRILNDQRLVDFENLIFSFTHTIINPLLPKSTALTQ